MPKRDAKKSDPKIDPFKIRKSKTSEQAKATADTVTPPEPVREAIDAFREAQEQARHFEGEATVHKNIILEYSQSEYAKRVLGGKNKSYKLLGDEAMVTYIVQDSSAGLSDDDLAELSERWGKNAADALVVRDYSSIKFDPAVLEANYDAVIEALQVLPDEVLENLFRPMLLKAKKNAVEVAKKYIKTPKEMNEILRQLKLKNYIK
jgi:hypothetical protein